MMYSIFLGLSGDFESAQYSAHWPATILLFAIAIRQRRNNFITKTINYVISFNVYYWCCNFYPICSWSNYI